MTREEMLEILSIADERDELKRQVQSHKKTITNLQRDQTEIVKKVNQFLAVLEYNNPRPQPKTTFIGPWECCPDEYPDLIQPEQYFRDGQQKKALNWLQVFLTRKDVGTRARINAKLLYAALLQSIGTNLRQALTLTEEALNAANKVRHVNLAAKANYWRGHCHLSLEECPNAKWCFVLASNLQGHTEAIQIGHEMAEKGIQLLAKDQRHVTPDFKYMCSAAMEDFVRNGRTNNALNSIRCIASY